MTRDRYCSVTKSGINLVRRCEVLCILFEDRPQSLLPACTKLRAWGETCGANQPNADAVRRLITRGRCDPAPGLLPNP